MRLRDASMNSARVRLIPISIISVKMGTKSRYLPNLIYLSLISTSSQYSSSWGGCVSYVKTSLIRLSFSIATKWSE